MIHRRMTGRRRGVLIGAAALVAVALGGTALAAQFAGEVKTFTGCLSSGDGVVVKVKEGMTPKSACSSAQTLVRMSGGDITKVTVTGGVLTGGGDNGDVTIGLDPKFALPQNCAAGKNLEWNGSAWECGTDDDTTYTAGTGLALGGNQFRIADDYLVKNTDDCPAGKFATGFDGNGAIQCATPAPALGDIWTDSDLGDAPEGSENTVVKVTVPAGNYLAIATGVARDDVGGNGDVDVVCHLEGPAGAIDTSHVAADASGVPSTAIALSSTTSLATQGDIHVDCISKSGSDGVVIELHAMRVGTIH